MNLRMLTTLMLLIAVCRTGDAFGAGTGIGEDSAMYQITFGFQHAF